MHLYALHTGAIKGKEGIKFCYLATQREIESERESLSLSPRLPFSKESTRRVITKRKIRNGGAAALDGWSIGHTADMAHIIWAERQTGGLVWCHKS